MQEESTKREINMGKVVGDIVMSMTQPLSKWWFLFFFLYAHVFFNHKFYMYIFMFQILTIVIGSNLL